MKIWMLCLLFCLPTQAQEPRPLILAAGASPLAYTRFLADHPAMISLTQHLAAIKFPTDEKIFALGDRLEEPLDSLLAEIENAHRETVQSEESLLFLRDLLDKAGLRNLNAAQRRRWQFLSCFNDNLRGQELISPCKGRNVSLLEIRKRFPWAEGLMVGARFVRLQTQGMLEVLPDGAYHYQILSNTHQMVSFFGTLESLLQQSLQPEPWIAGTCDEFTTTVSDWNLLEQGAVFFNESCILPLKNPPRKTSAQRWMKENKNWLYAGGAFVLGAVVYGMRNKKMVIDTSGL